jgi:hypothetical protein
MFIHIDDDESATTIALFSFKTRFAALLKITLSSSIIVQSFKEKNYFLTYRTNFNDFRDKTDIFTITFIFNIFKWNNF